MKIRKMIFQPPNGHPQDNQKPILWVNSVFYTCLLNATSVALTSGERFFIASVNFYRNQVTDPKLKKEIAIFLGQEKWHMMAHDGLNAYVKSSSYMDEEIYKNVDKDFKEAYKMSNAEQLSLTLASEHYTAILSRFLLGSPSHISRIDPHFRKLWIQHCIEELEHKSVAFDVFQHLNLGYWTRIKGFLLASWNVPIQIFGGTFKLIRKSDSRIDAYREAFSFFFHLRTGFIWSFLPEFFGYFSPSFHPSQTKDEEMIDKYTAEYNLAESEQKAS